MQHGVKISILHSNGVCINLSHSVKQFANCRPAIHMLHKNSFKFFSFFFGGVTGDPAPVGCFDARGVCFLKKKYYLQRNYGRELQLWYWAKIEHFAKRNCAPAFLVQNRVWWFDGGWLGSLPNTWRLNHQKQFWRDSWAIVWSWEFMILFE